MTESPPSTTSLASRWWPAIICSLVVALAVVAYAYQMHGELLAEIKATSNKQSDERSKLSARVDALQSSLATVSGQPKVDTEALSGQFTEMNSKLSTLGDRIATLEKKPEPAPAAPAPAPPAAPAAANDSAALKLVATSGKPFTVELAAWQKAHPKVDAQTTAPLAVTAQSGIPSEAEMNGRLRTALDEAAHNKKIDDVSLIGKINTHLSGLVSITKTADAGPYEKLRAEVMREDIATLTSDVERLKDADRKPLEDWLTIAHARRDALAALDHLDTTGGAE